MESTKTEVWPGQAYPLGAALRHARLKLGPEPVKMADQLAPQRPSDWAGRRGGPQQLAEPVLLGARRGQMAFQLSLQRVVTARVQLGREAAVRPHGGG